MNKSDHFLFFAEDLTHDMVTLDINESRHVSSALRFCEGTQVHLTDGNGSLAAGHIVSPEDRRRTAVAISSRRFSSRRRPQVRLCIGLPDRDAFETILADATALGTAEIVPIDAQYCQKKWWSADWNKNLPRFRQKMIAACKQSRNVYLPHIARPCTPVQAAAQTAAGPVFVADGQGRLLSDYPSSVLPDTVTCFIGPPGGFSKQETSLFDRHGFNRVAIAPSRLRTGLAATVLCAQLIGRFMQGQ